VIAIVRPPTIVVDRVVQVPVQPQQRVVALAIFVRPMLHVQARVAMLILVHVISLIVILVLHVAPVLTVTGMHMHMLMLG
jgi:hypothetical protein